jgi:hypothetical protein
VVSRLWKSLVLNKSRKTLVVSELCSMLACYRRWILVVHKSWIILVVPGIWITLVVYGKWITLMVPRLWAKLMVHKKLYNP